MEVQALQSRQKEEIEALFTRMGKQPPPTVCSPAVAMAGGRRRLKSKSHKSSRSSIQPSPIHSGTTVNLIVFLVLTKETECINLCFMSVLETLCFCFSLKCHYILCSCAQDLQLQLRVLLI